MEQKKIKVFFISNAMGDFIARDIRLLEKYFQVKTLHFYGLKSLPQNLFQIIKQIKWADVTFSNFADIHAFLTTYLSKKLGLGSIVLIGGYEVAQISEFKYGLNRSRSFPMIVRKALKNADTVITVSPQLKEEAITHLNIDPNKIIVVPNGFDHTTFQPDGQKQQTVMTASVCSKMNTVRLKGVDTLLVAAKLLPHIPFKIIGITEAIQRELGPSTPANVELIKPIPHEELIPHYKKTQVYCQLSLREGHPNALCEAMLCECVPVISDTPGNTYAAGKVGFSVPYANPEKTAAAIKKALDSDLGARARESIMERFPLEKREHSLQKIISDLC